jgi:hypothetical protein
METGYGSATGFLTGNAFGSGTFGSGTFGTGTFGTVEVFQNYSENRIPPLEDAFQGLLDQRSNILSPIPGESISEDDKTKLIQIINTIYHTDNGTHFITNTFIHNKGQVNIDIFLIMLIIILSLQTKLGEKVSIIVDRIMEVWNGNEKELKKKNNNKQQNVKISQPISNPNKNILINEIPYYWCWMVWLSFSIMFN